LLGFPRLLQRPARLVVLYLGAWFPALAEEPQLLAGISVNDLIAVGLVWFLVAVHSRETKGAFAFNNAVTLLKVGGIVLIIIAATLVGEGDLQNFSYVSDHYNEMSRTQLFTALSTSLIFVMFCYSGWNAAAYITSEIVEPQKSLPKALLAGTLVVTILYLLLNAVYIYGANVDELAGKVEVGLVASRQLFGTFGTSLVTTVLVVSLIASASAMTIAGPRVYYSLGQDIRRFRALSLTNKAGAPGNALLLQGVVTTIVILTGSVDQILAYAGFTLALMSTLAVSCVIVLRIKRPDMPRPFKVYAYPLPPIIFLSVSLWTMFWAFEGRPLESSLALLTVAAGGGIFVMASLIKRSS
jgi:APA family basic amino acid/polyamine antiporter